MQITAYIAVGSSPIARYRDGWKRMIAEVTLGSIAFAESRRRAGLIEERGVVESLDTEGAIVAPPSPGVPGEEKHGGPSGSDRGRYAKTLLGWNADALARSSDR